MWCIRWTSPRRVGAERLREIMTELSSVARRWCSAMAARCDKFTGDGIMALFGAPVALEDHAFRACLAALDIQEEIDAAGRRGCSAAMASRCGCGSG